jgi:hypothetical protein
VWPSSVPPLDAGELGGLATEGRVLICEGCGEAEAFLECECCGEHVCDECWGEGDPFCGDCMGKNGSRPVEKVHLRGDYL